MEIEKNLTVQDWLGEDNQLGIDIWERKYCYNKESFDNWLNRVSGGNKEIAQMILDKKFLFGGRILAMRGVKDGSKYTLSNCYVLPAPKDNLESIYDTCKALARTYSYGGGCGVDISNLAPEGAKVNNQAKTSTGAISFMSTFSQVTETIGQHNRRGALMISIDCTHPDLEKFITIKTDLDEVNFANISVRVSDDFMRAVENDENWELYFERPETNESIRKTVKAKDIFELLCKTNWDYAEPGILFWDNINNYNLQSEVEEFSYAGTNPCLVGETLISTTKGDIPIKDLVGQTPDVYCMRYNGELYIQQATRVWLTRKDVEIVTVHTKAQNLKCTPDHLIYVDNKGWVQAKDLIGGDKVIGFGINQNYKGAILDPVEVIEVTYETETQDVYDMTVPVYHNFIANNIVVHNCAEEPLPANGSCLLGSLNLSAFVDELGVFDTEEFEHCIQVAIEALNEVQAEGADIHPLPEQRWCAYGWKPIGLGIMGLADMLIKMGITYGSEEAIEVCDNIGRLMARTAIKSSAIIASNQHPYSKYNVAIRDSVFYKNHITKGEEIDNTVCSYGLRNSQLLTIAPTGLNIGSV